MKIHILPATIADIDEVTRLVERHPYAEYRCYGLFHHDFAADHLAHAVHRLLAASDPLACMAVAEGQVVGFAGAARADWESAHFGIEMASIPVVLAERAGPERIEVVDALLAAVMAEAGERGIRHLALKIDIADLVALRAAEQRSFRLVDTVVTYVDVAARRAPARPDINPAFELATYRKDQFHQFTREEIEPLADFMRQGFRIDRFHMDHRLPTERSNEVYAEWCWNIFGGTWADMIHAARLGGRLVGFLGLQYFPELKERYGVNVAGRGLAAVLPEVRGGYMALVGHTIANTPLDFGEYDTQIQNFPVINVWIRHAFAFLRGRFTLHRWLDE